MWDQSGGSGHTRRPGAAVTRGLKPSPRGGEGRGPGIQPAVASSGAQHQHQLTAGKIHVPRSLVLGSHS